MGSSRRYILHAVEASLRRLGTDYIDLYQLHFPFPGVPMEETLRALDDLVHQGKVRYIGSLQLRGLAARRRELDRAVTESTSRPSSRRSIPTTCSTGRSSTSSMPACLAHGDRPPALLPAGERLLSPASTAPGERRPEGARLADGSPKTDTLTGQPDAHRASGSKPEMLVRWLTEESIFNEENYAILEQLDGLRRSAGPHVCSSLRSPGWRAQPGVGEHSRRSFAARAQIEQNARAADWKLAPEELAEVAAVTASALHPKAVPTEL